MNPSTEGQTDGQKNRQAEINIHPKQLCDCCKILRANEPNPIIVRFVSRADRDHVLKVRKNLKTYNEDKDIKLYINEDLTAIRVSKLKCRDVIYQNTEILSDLQNP